MCRKAQGWRVVVDDFCAPAGIAIFMAREIGSVMYGEGNAWRRYPLAIYFRREGPPPLPPSDEAYGLKRHKPPIFDR